VDREITLAPIILFVYNRLDHTKKTVQALLDNQLADKSTIFIFSDGAKDDKERYKVNEVREYIKTINGFKNINIIYRDRNWGLANSIIDGVTKVISEFDKAIVLEDDLVSSPFFLKYMNESLDHFKEIKDVYHISGWNYPFSNDQLGDVFLWRLMNCWGWATWSDRWSLYKKNTKETISEFTSSDIKRFNIDGVEDFWGQILANRDGKINTWAIFWYATIYKNRGLCVNPSKSFITNIGHDDSGVNCTSTNEYISELNMNKNIDFDIDIIESAMAIKEVKNFYQKNKKNIFQRIVNRFKLN
tara:strand:+ start:21282 stop:22184 length:903 start_codon:yes stop_codon:yes gene_type:complete